MVHRFAQRQLRTGASSLFVGSGALLVYMLALYSLPVEHHSVAIDGLVLTVLMLLNAVTALSLIRAARVVDRLETRRNFAEREVRRRRAWLESVVENMPVGVGVIERSSDTVVLSNAIYRSLMQEADGDFPVRVAHRAVRLLDRNGMPLGPNARPSIRALQFGETSRDVELQVEMAGNQKAWIAVSAAPIQEEDGTTQAAVVAFSDITARKRIEGEKEALMRRLVEVQEEERLHFARELHDELGQDLTALAIGLKAFETTNNETARAERLREMHAILERMSNQVHHLAGNLRPLLLEDLGLRAAVEELALGWGAKLGIGVDLLLEGLAEPMPNATAISIYRVVQEGLTNVARHSQASNVSITSRRIGNVLRVVIEDDGRGFELSKADGPRTRRNGFVGMRERLAAIGGTLTVESEPGRGTSLFIVVPTSTAEGKR
ncbi:ATP-binding protein [Aureimonas sp. AU4]|uniref:sensor histidine kinase n=1 Tax=Aureimonas sp. AU4 TaxID=1638163 RepID=UPI000A81BC72|nr:ATP-binding protein [Aureimonas sp. AU4]